MYISVLLLQTEKHWIFMIFDFQFNSKAYLRISKACDSKAISFQSYFNLIWKTNYTALRNLPHWNLKVNFGAESESNHRICLINQNFEIFQPKSATKHSKIPILPAFQLLKTDFHAKYDPKFFDNYKYSWLILMIFKQVYTFSTQYLISHENRITKTEMKVI